MTVSTELAVIHDEGAIEVSDPQAYVELACQRAKAWLVQALECRDVEQLVEIRSQAEAIRAYTHQKELGKDAELSATEIIRRAERAIHLAVDRAREQGEILRIGQTARRPGHHVRGPNMVKTLGEVGINRAALASTTPLAKDVSDELFEEATAQARAERDLSRANLIRKIKGKATLLPLLSRLETVTELARSGASSRQMAEKLGVRADRITALAREHGIDIPADRIVGRTRHIDPDRIVRETINTLEGIEYNLNLLTAADYTVFTSDQATQWLGMLNSPIKCVRTLQKELINRVNEANSTIDIDRSEESST